MRTTKKQNNNGDITKTVFQNYRELSYLTENSLLAKQSTELRIKN